MTERELERRAQRKLAVLRHVEEVSGNVAATCRYYAGIAATKPKASTVSRTAPASRTPRRG